MAIYTYIYELTSFVYVLCKYFVFLRRFLKLRGIVLHRIFFDSCSILGILSRNFVFDPIRFRTNFTIELYFRIAFFNFFPVSFAQFLQQRSKSILIRITSKSGFSAAISSLNSPFNFTNFLWSVCRRHACFMTPFSCNLITFSTIFRCGKKIKKLKCK